MTTEERPPNLHDSIGRGDCPYIDAIRVASSLPALGWLDKIDLTTPVGIEEMRVFCILRHNPDYIWLGVPGIAKRAGLDAARAGVIVGRHLTSGLIVRHPAHSQLYAESESARHWLGAQVRRAASPAPIASTAFR